VCPDLVEFVFSGKSTTTCESSQVKMLKRSMHLILGMGTPEFEGVAQAVGQNWKH